MNLSSHNFKYTLWHNNSDFKDKTYLNNFPFSLRNIPKMISLKSKFIEWKLLIFKKNGI